MTRLLAKETEMESPVVEDPVLRQRLSFSRTTDEDGGEVLHVETWVDPGGGVTPHVHPAMEEHFEVLEGRLSFLAGRKWRTASPGDTVVVPAGVRHAYRNRGDEVAHMVCHARPPSSLQAFLEDTAALSRAGKITGRGLPKGPSGLLGGAALAEGYRDMVVLGFPPMPPPFLQRILFPALARLGERRGYRPGRFSETLGSSNGAS
jgi:quercetin dioxygenase-like cupin family protein